MNGKSQPYQDPDVEEAIAAGMPECPNCHSRNVRASAPTGLRDTLMALVNYAAFRCRVCQDRFYKKAPRYIVADAEEPDSPEPANQKPAGG